MNSLAEYLCTRKNGGFALIIALSLMSFIVLLTLTMSALLKTQIEESSTGLESDVARNNALLGLQIALGDIQKYAGPDQRTTATADILATTTNAEQNFFTGVWNSAAPDPITAATKGTFLRWLVSQPFGAAAALPQSLPASTTYPLGKVALVIDHSGSASPVDPVEVEKISAPNSLGTGNYAYWVGDDGVKAKANLPYKSRNLSFDDTYADYTNSAQNLVASPRYGIEHFDTVPTDGTDYSQYKDSLNDLASTRQDFQSLMKKIISKDQVQLIDTSITRKFDKINDTYFHDFTTHSMGLLTNTAKGGLKEDLSLAFEYGIKKSADSVIIPNTTGLTGDDRYIFTMPNFSHPRVAGLITILGPRWDLLQEHYNLYKGLGMEYEFPLQVPPAADAVDRHPVQYTQFGNPHGVLPDANKTSTGQPYRAFYRGMRFARDAVSLNYPRAHSTVLAPVVLAASHTYSLYSPAASVPQDLTDPDNILPNTVQIIGNPVVTLWNPYNIRLKMEATELTPFVRIRESFNFEFKGSGLITTVPATASGSLHSQNGTSGASSFQTDSTGLKVPISELDFKPGEIKVFSAANDATNRADTAKKLRVQDAQLGYNPNGGWIWENLNSTTNPYSALITTNEIIVKAESTGQRVTSLNVDGTSNATYGNHEEFYSQRYAEPRLGNYTYNSDESLVHTIGMLAGGDPYPFLNSYCRTMAPDDFDPDSLAPFVRPMEIFIASNPRAWFTGPRSSSFQNHFRSPNTMFEMLELDGTGILPFDVAGNNGFWGASYSSSSGYSQLACWEIPRSPLLSIAQLQHAHTQRMFYEPSYPIGNSYATPYVTRNVTFSWRRIGGRHCSSLDMSYLMNEALWDGYYFSSLSPELDDQTSSIIAPYLSESKPLAATGSGVSVIKDFSNSNAKSDVLRNPRMTFYRSDNKTNTQIETLLEIDTPGAGEINGSLSVAAFMMVDGGFNVNSTSVNAWKSLLSGLNNIQVPVFDTLTNSMVYTRSTDTTPEKKNVFSRFALPMNSENSIGVNTTDNNHWEGFRSLSDDHITELATNIVTEIKSRGPSFSLADFINRKLETTGDHWRSGAIQSAIDATNEMSGTPTGINAEMLKDYPYTMNKEGSVSGARLSEPYARTGYSDGGAASNSLKGFTVGGAPGYLMQADILNSIGPFLNNRSNTFTIRTYGDSTDIHGTVTSKAYLEVVVQQVTDFVDSTDIATTDMASISTINQTFGRKFKIVSFKWINESDL